MKHYYHTFATSTPVAIPIIQRDYVQGANKNSKKRDKFLKSILEALKKPVTDYPIDFIYGSTDTNNNRFIPIDGQQRLTTLMLLGWLLNQKAGGKYNDSLPLLTYHTRPSTEQFCNHLVKYTLPEDTEIISKHLKEVPGWFSRRWQEDASILSMLEFLDYADMLMKSDEFKNDLVQMADNFFKGNPVTFEHLDMKALELNDDLYIKMNARGKQLTNFENWKAAFEDFLEQNFQSTIYQYGKIPEMDQQPLVAEYFIHYIEHDWTDMLWKIALDQWRSLPDTKRQEASYPYTDDLFMNIYRYITQMLFFTSLPNGQQIIQGQDTTLRKMYEDNEEEIQEALYKDQANLFMLFRILDLFVEIDRIWPKGIGFFDTIFSNTYDSKSKKVNLYKDNNINLLDRCLRNQLDAVADLLLWAIIQYLLKYPSSLSEVAKNPNMFLDYLRTVVGMLRGRKQRLVKGLDVRPDINQVDYYAFGIAIEELLADPDVHISLAASNSSLLAAEKKKNTYLGTPAYDVITALSGHPSLYYTFTALYDSFNSVKSQQNAQDYIRRFESLMKSDNTKRIQKLMKHGYGGIKVIDQNIFFGAPGKWDYIFTSESNHLKKVMANWFLQTKVSSFNNDTLQYYIEKYPEFIKAVYDPDTNSPHFYFYIPGSPYTAWAFKSYSKNPILGYNTCPYAFTVYRKWSSPKIALWPQSYYSEHGRLYLYPTDQWSDDVYMECVNNGWEIVVNDKRRKIVNILKARYYDSVTEEFKDSQGIFSFKDNILLDMPGKDRIETALEFLGAL